MIYTLFIDDERNPADVSWMAIPFVGTTIVARTFDHVKDLVAEHGVPAHVSFDHDLANFDPEGNELTGYTCAKWLVDYCVENKILFPSYTVHSMNPIGRKRIIDYIEWAKNTANI